MSTKTKRPSARAKKPPSAELPALYIRCPQDVFDRVHQLAAADDRSLTAWFTRLVRSM